MAKLSKMPKHGKSFSLAYINNGRNATKAARSLLGVSEKSASEVGSRLLRNVEVQAEIARLEKKIEGKTLITKERVLNRLAVIAFSDPADVMSWNESGINLTPSDKLTPSQRATIKSISHHTTATGESFKVEQQSSLEACKEINKVMGYYPEQQVKLPGGGIILITNVKDDE